MATQRTDTLCRLNSLLTERFGAIVGEILTMVEEMVKADNQYFPSLQKEEANFDTVPSGPDEDGTEGQERVKLEVDVSTVSQPHPKSELASTPAAGHGTAQSKPPSEGEESRPARPAVVSAGTQSVSAADGLPPWDEARTPCPRLPAAGTVAGERPLPCGNVKIMFPLSQRAGERIRRGETAYLCRFCGTVLFSLSEMRRHEEVHGTRHEEVQAADGPKRLGCRLCSRRFSDANTLLAHSLLHKYAETRAKEWKKVAERVPAPASETRTTGQEGNEMSARDAREPPSADASIGGRNATHLCEVCGETFSDGTHLKRHRLCHKAKCHRCSYCDKSFTLRSNLARHERLHTGEKPFSCRYCGRGFSDASALKSHVWHKHQKKVVKGRTHRCGSCDKAFTHKHLLDKHLRLHARSNPDPCGPTGDRGQQGCSEGPTDSSVPVKLEGTPEEPEDPRVEGEAEGAPLDECVNKKARVEPSDPAMPGGSSDRADAPDALDAPDAAGYSCRWCDMKLRTLSAITRHERVHTGEKPFSCSYCEKSFSLLSNMQRHERLHTGEKPYGCDYCDKRYTDSSGLRFHVKAHLRERKKGNDPVTCR